MRSGSLICILALFIFGVSSADEVKESDFTSVIQETLKELGEKETKAYLIQFMQSFINETKPYREMDGIDEGWKSMASNVVDSIELLINEIQAAVITDEGTQLHDVNNTLARILVEFERLSETAEKLKKGFNHPYPLTRDDIKLLYLTLEKDSDAVAKASLVNALQQELKYLVDYRATHYGFASYGAATGGSKLVDLLQRLDTLTPVGLTKAEMTAIVDAFLEIYDTILYAL